MDRILITGATGYVGRALVARLAASRHTLVLATRTGDPIGPLPSHIQQTPIGEIGPSTDWDSALSGCTVVIHLAARTPGRGIEEAEFNTVNDLGTAWLVEQTMRSGVQLFINLSSLHAVSSDGSEAHVDDRTTPRPTSSYGKSKLAAEGHVGRLAVAGVQAVSLRPPLVIGAEAVGHWRLLQKLAASGVPLPFGGLTTPRSLISIDNLVDAIATVIASSDRIASARSFFVADPEPSNLRDIFELLRQGMKVPRRLFPLPRSILASAMIPLGPAFAAGLLSGTTVDQTAFRSAFGWEPPLTTRQGIIGSGRDFVKSQ